MRPGRSGTCAPRPSARRAPLKCRSRTWTPPWTPWSLPSCPTSRCESTRPTTYGCRRRCVGPTEPASMTSTGRPGTAPGGSWTPSRWSWQPPAAPTGAGSAPYASASPSPRQPPTDMLDPSQAALVTALATSGARVQVALAPAGTGKTTAMRVLGDLWRDSGGTVLGLAPSAAAARELGRALSSRSRDPREAGHRRHRRPHHPTHHSRPARTRCCSSTRPEWLLRRTSLRS